jgi:hypothetical protein
MVKKQKEKYKNIYEILGVEQSEFEEVIKNKTNYYYSYPIRKRNGRKRYIDAPIEPIKSWQKIVTNKILYRYGPHKIAYGFARGKSPIDAAREHVGQEILISMDIKNFFNSIDAEGLANLFKYLHRVEPFWILNSDPKNFLSSSTKLALKNVDLINLLTFRGRVPQGAPSSPALSNLYMLRVDKLLSNLAENYGMKVTRYADDIVFSGKEQSGITNIIISHTKGFLKKYNLNLNPHKIHVNRKYRRMRTVGIVVNEKINIPREKWRNFRALLHNLKVSQAPIDKSTAQKLRGKIEWYKSVNPKRGKQFLREYGQLNFINT